MIPSSSSKDPLGDLLLSWNLYDELYLLFKGKGLTINGLKYMKTRHIDQIFNEHQLNSKIIFEHHLNRWQSEIGQQNEFLSNCDLEEGFNAMRQHTSNLPLNISNLPLSESNQLLTTSNQTVTTSNQTATTSNQTVTTSNIFSSTSSVSLIGSHPHSCTKNQTPITSIPSSTSATPSPNTSNVSSRTKHPSSSTSTPCPSTSTPCPSTSTPCPSTSKPCPSTSTPCPSTSTPCPSTSTPCPSTSTPCPSTSTPCPSTSKPCPSTSTPCPSTSTPCPSTSTPCPSTSTPCPSTSTPCPSTKWQSETGDRNEFLSKCDSEARLNKTNQPMSNKPLSICNLPLSIGNSPLSIGNLPLSRSNAFTGTSNMKINGSNSFRSKDKQSPSNNQPPTSTSNPSPGSSDPSTSTSNAKMNESIKIKTSDGKIFEMGMELMKYSRTFKYMVEVCSSQDTIVPLVKVSSKAFVKLLEWVNHKEEMTRGAEDPMNFVVTPLLTNESPLNLTSGMIFHLVFFANFNGFDFLIKSIFDYVFNKIDVRFNYFLPGTSFRNAEEVNSKQMVSKLLGITFRLVKRLEPILLLFGIGEFQYQRNRRRRDRIDEQTSWEPTVDWKVDASAFYEDIKTFIQFVQRHLQNDRVPSAKNLEVLFERNKTSWSLEESGKRKLLEDLKNIEQKSLDIYQLGIESFIKKLGLSEQFTTFLLEVVSNPFQPNKTSRNIKSRGVDNFKILDNEDQWFTLCQGIASSPILGKIVNTVAFHIISYFPEKHDTFIEYWEKLGVNPIMSNTSDSKILTWLFGFLFNKPFIENLKLILLYLKEENILGDVDKLFICLHTILAPIDDEMMNISQTQTIKLQTSNGDVFHTNVTLKECDMILKILLHAADLDEFGTVRLLHMHTMVFKKILAWATYFKATEDSSLSESGVTKWDSEFFSVDRRTLFEIIWAADYLDIPELLDLSCRAVGVLLNGHHWGELTDNIAGILEHSIIKIQYPHLCFVSLKFRPLHAIV